MPVIWDQSLIRELLVRAELQDSSSAVLDSEREAERFRYAIYNFRKEHDLGHGISITIDGNMVKLTRQENPAIVIVQE